MNSITYSSAPPEHDKMYAEESCQLVSLLDRIPSLNLAMQSRSWSDVADDTAQQLPHIPWSKMMRNRNAQSGYCSRRSKLGGIFAAIGGRTIGFCVVPPVVEVVVEVEVVDVL